MHERYTRIIVLALVGGLLLAGQVRRLEAGEPLDKVRQTVDAVLATLADETLQPQERRARIRQAVLQRFGFDEMAQRALGHHWRALTPQQQHEFVDLFTDLLARSYMHRIMSYNPGTQSVRYVSEDINQDYAAVRTEIMSEHDLLATVAYRLLYTDGTWKVYDIVIEGVSLVNNYRTQFNTIIVQDSYAPLVKQMRVKLAQEQAISPQQG